MIHTMHLSREDKARVGRRLLLETTEEHLSKAYERLEHLLALKDGWAGENTLSISRQVIANLRDVLLISNNKDWECWMISPDGNGTVMLQSNQRRSSISVGSKEFSYYTKVDGKRSGKSHLDFNAKQFLTIMREIAK